jgi:hypothetical protein
MGGNSLVFVLLSLRDVCKMGHPQQSPSEVPVPHVVEMSDEDYAAYEVYLALPTPIRWAVRAVVYLSRSDQRLIRGIVVVLRRASGDDGPGLPCAPVASTRVVRGRRLVRPSRWRRWTGDRAA